jgi:hypothetical protein
MIIFFQKKHHFSEKKKRKSVQYSRENQRGTRRHHDPSVWGPVHFPPVVQYSLGQTTRVLLFHGTISRRQLNG